MKVNGCTVSVQNGYDLVINKCSLNRYRMYKKLLLHGFKVMRYSAMMLKNNKVIGKVISKQDQINMVKRKSDDKDILEPSKRHCPESSTRGLSSKSQQMVIKQVFDILQKHAPQVYNNHLPSGKAPDYCIYMANNKSRSNYDLSLDIW